VEKILHLEVDIFSSHSREVGVTSLQEKKKRDIHKYKVISKYTRKFLEALFACKQGNPPINKLFFPENGLKRKMATQIQFMLTWQASTFSFFQKLKSTHKPRYELPKKNGGLSSVARPTKLNLQNLLHYPTQPHIWPPSLNLQMPEMNLW
jgi:hypothetical protein